MHAPICLFTYNRILETKKTVEALKKNDLASNSDLFIFSDGHKNEEDHSRVNDIRAYLYTITGFKSISIIESQENKGLANSIILGVTQIIKDYRKVIVIEDDLITSTNFLSFMNQALNYYQTDKNIQSINGFSLHITDSRPNSDIYFQKRPFSWGWATWSNRWNADIFDKQKLKTELNSNKSILKQFENECGKDIAKMLLYSINNKNDSWYVRWAYNHFKTNRYSVYPIKSLVENIGFGEEGTHCKTINPFKYIIDDRHNVKFNFTNFSTPRKEDTQAFLKYFSLSNKIHTRIKLLGNSSGRKKLLAEIKIKIKDYEKTPKKN